MHATNKKSAKSIINDFLNDAGYLTLPMHIDHGAPHIGGVNVSDHFSMNPSKTPSKSPCLLVVGDGEHEDYFVYIHFQENWNNKIFFHIQECVKFYDEIILFFVFLENNNKNFFHIENNHIRCCKIKYDNSCDEGMVSVFRTPEDQTLMYEPITYFGGQENDWLRLQPLQSIFSKIQNINIYLNKVSSTRKP